MRLETFQDQLWAFLKVKKKQVMLLIMVEEDSFDC